jgi:UDP-N-acetylglucosamine 2-epimerase
MKIISIVGTRPQFLKLCPLVKTFKKNNINHKIIHTGQHFDYEMSDELFNIFNIPKPDYLFNRPNLPIVSTIATMMINIENIILDEKPNHILVYGDCDSTIAGALVANKLKINLIHIEAGMRSYNKSMPEEINRILTDHISDLLLCSTIDCLDNLKKENIYNNVYYVGNLQLELLEDCCKNYNNEAILLEYNIEKNNFALLTIHREYNTNDIMINKIFSELKNLKEKIIFPIHPRTKKIIEIHNISIPKNIILIKPVNYLNMTILERNCKFIITDSGGVQPEAWYLDKKCIIMRSETEWLEPLESKNNILYDYITPLDIFIINFLTVETTKKNIVNNASETILNHILQQ